MNHSFNAHQCRLSSIMLWLNSVGRFTHQLLQVISQRNFLSCILSTFLSDAMSDILSSILSDYLSSRLKSGEAHSAQTLAGWSPARPTARRLSPVDVRRSPQRADPRRLKSRRGPQRADSHRLRSGEAHSAQTLAGWGPAMPSAIKSWQWRSGEAHCDQELEDEVRRGPWS